MQTLHVGPKALAVRADFKPESARIGQLKPYRTLCVLRLEPYGGGVRACVALDDPEADRVTIESWRRLALGMPRWKYTPGGPPAGTEAWEARALHGGVGGAGVGAGGAAGAGLVLGRIVEDSDQLGGECDTSSDIPQLRQLTASVESRLALGARAAPPSSRCSSVQSTC